MTEQRKDQKRVSRKFTLMSVVWRFVAALALVLITYNPSEYSFYHWIDAALVDRSLEITHYAVAGGLLLCWAIIIFATQRPLDILGMILAAALLGTSVWLLMDRGILQADSVTMLNWIVLVCIAVVLAVGLSWSRIWRRPTRQSAVVDTDR